MDGVGAARDAFDAGRFWWHEDVVPVVKFVGHNCAEVEVRQANAVQLQAKLERFRAVSAGLKGGRVGSCVATVCIGIQR